MKLLRALLTTALLAFAGCATPYEEKSPLAARLFGGVSIEEVGQNTYRVFAQGNPYTSPLQVRTYAYRRAAQQARDSGFDGFRIVDGADLTQTQTGAIAVAGTQGAAGFGATTIYPATEFLVRLTNDPYPPQGFFRASDWPTGQ